MKTRLTSLLLLSILLLAAPASPNAQTPARPQKQPPQKVSPIFATSLPRYLATLWKQADSLADLDQPQSALAVVDRIYAQAKKDKNDPQVIKAILYTIKLNSEFQENFLLRSIDLLKKEFAASSAPSRQILQSVLGEVYWKFYQNNMYRFADRTRVRTNTPDSIETWDLKTISAAVTHCYLASLANPDTLKKIPIGRFDAIVNCEPFDEKKQAAQTAVAIKFNPTLYDLLAGRALDFFTTSNGTAIFTAQRFELDRPDYFDQSAGFAGNRMTATDSSSQKSLALHIFRDLAAFHLNDPDRRALIDAELRRFAFVHDESTLAGKDTLYRDALQKFAKTESASPWSAGISYTLASFLNSQGQLYNPLLSPAHKWEIRSALEICDNTIARFPDSEGAKNCRILAKSIKSPVLLITAESAIPVEKPSLALVQFGNMKTLFFRLVKTDPDAYGDETGTSQPAQVFKHLASMPAVKSWTQQLPSDGDFQKHAAEIVIPAIPAGFYVLICSTRENFSDASQVYAWSSFWSTQISYVSRGNDDGSTGYFLLDRETGVPLPHVRAEAWTRNWNYATRKNNPVKLQELISDNEGFFELPPVTGNGPGTNVYFKLFYKNDLLITDNYYRYQSWQAPEKTSLKTLFYTDRAIYRPGQVISFNGILLEKTGDRSAIKPDQPTKVVFTDVNGQKIAEQTLVSNDFGSFHGSFTAPTGVLPGQMTIANESGSVYISVEEYKRPTFDVSWQPLEGNYRLGETITVSGKASAYAGNAIDGAAVKYRIVRNARFPFFEWGMYRPWPISPPAEVSSGTAATGHDGKFTFTFQALPDPSVDPKTDPVFDFSIVADVTDVNGETQSAQQEVSVGFTALLLGLNLSDTVNLAADSLLKITTTNLNGRSTPSRVTITLDRLHQPGRIFKQRFWARPDLNLMTREEFHAQFPNDIYDDENNPETWTKEASVFEKTVSTATDSVLKINGPGTPLLQPGSYRLVLKATDQFGQPVEKRLNFTAFSPASTALPVDAAFWFAPLKISGEPGQSARVIVGSKDDNVRMIYEVRRRDTLISREWIRLSDHARLLDIPILEKYRGNFTVNFLFVKHNRAFQRSLVIDVPYTNKKLAITFETFRNKLEPGVKETWKIKIARAGGQPAAAEFMAGMYDASLDQFRSNNWLFDIYQYYGGTNPWNGEMSFRNARSIVGGAPAFNEDYSVHPVLKLNWFGLEYFGGYGGHRKYSQVLGRNRLAMAPMVVEDAVEMDASPAPPAEMETISAKFTAPVVVEDSVQRRSAKASLGLQVRRDFRETAFFYPAVTTDSTGSLELQFTAPESLTKWKLMGLAHSKSLEYGLIEKEVMTRKDLMVFPNAPRFVRQGDTVIFSAKVVSLADHDMDGEVSLQLVNGITQQPAGSIAVSPAPLVFHVKTGQSAPVSWKLVIPVTPDLQVLQYRMTATAGNFSDGEEKMIPVLTNRMMVTESLPLPVRGKGTTEFTFEKLLKSDQQAEKSSTLKNYRLTLEFASNPAWYAIQALPALNDEQYDNADAIFSAYWSNSVASFIASSNPKIRAVFESWKSLTPDALLSNLAKNQQLKSALLQETPWVTEASDETGRKQKLGLYFDQNTIESNLRENLKKLQKLQTPNGGWSWFAGMPENRYTTQTIVTGLGQLQHLGITGILRDATTRDMVTKAIGYLDGEMLKDYERLKKDYTGKLDNNHLGSTEIQYLYTRSFFMEGPGSAFRNLAPKFRDAFSYYQKQAEKYWQPNELSMQAMIALALNRLDRKEVPQLILKSLAEKSLHSPEMGMYWAADPGYYWYQAPVENQALMIEAFDEAGHNPAAVEELKIWLLKQKQTRNWRSSRATLEACYALLLRGTDLLADDPGVKISLGREKISSDNLADVNKEAGTGYFQYSWQGEAVNPGMGKIAVSKSTAGVAWGAVYWQYFEDLDKITPAATPLKLEKKLFVEKNSPDGPVLEEVTKDEGRKTKDEGRGTWDVGEKAVVKIVLKVDRDLEFVHMKDMRASGFEPAAAANRPGEGAEDNLSGYRYQDGLGYYQTTTDQATSFFFDYLPKGTYVFEYALRANAAGEYSNGITTVQCMYAPEFAAHSEGIRITIR